VNTPHTVSRPRLAQGLSRRRLLRLATFLALGGTGAAAAACAPPSTPTPPSRQAPVGGRPTAPTPAPAGEGSFPEPPVRRSAGGLLETTLEARVVRTRLAGRDATTAAFEGTVPGPTLRVRPGDQLRIRLVNRLDEPTNLHFHGLHVPPTGNGDNPFVHVMPGESLDYELKVPADHPAGTFWYHPHLHGRSADQVFAGLVGAIVVEGDLDRVPEIAAARERLLVLTDTTLDGGGRVPPATMMDAMDGREGELVTVNGTSLPTIALRPGEVQRWRILNAGGARFYRLGLAGHRLHRVALDGGPLAAPVAVDDLLLPPGKRAEVLVQAGPAGSYALRSLPYDRGGMGMGMGGGMMGGGRASASSGAEVPLLRAIVRGEPVAADLPARLVDAPDAAADVVAARRELTLSEAMGPGGMRFLIDGRAFDPDRVDVRARLGTTEEWTIRNATHMDHPFHLHVNPFQVVARDGRPVRPPGWEDTTNLPAGASVTVRIRFKDFRGKSVFHCHILEHEDRGMMGVVEVA
jgi:FtsP/CotA-like multicopper oxidase with cupredoxin domain